MPFMSNCIIFAIMIFNGLLAGAAPLNRQKGLITVPIRSLHRQAAQKLFNPHVSISILLFFQKFIDNFFQHFNQTINRAYRRAGKLTGRQIKVANTPNAPDSLGLDINGADSGCKSSRLLL